MGLFGNSKKKSSCCTFQVEEVKEDKKQELNSICCNFKSEEVKDNKTPDKSSEGCCG